MKMGILAVVLLALGCSGSPKSAATGATSTTTTAVTVPTTTGVVPPTTTPAGTDDNAVRKRISNAVVLEQVVYSNSGSYSADLETLDAIDSGLQFGAGLSPPTNPTIVNVAVSPDGQWACLIAASSVAGHVFVAAVGPSQKVYAGVAILTKCSAAAGRILRLVAGF